ncbi:MAG: ATPase [Candidatus Micrarchaeia archaeon]|jgi:V/A-type H+-transporting ATPase subunit K
MVELLGTEGAAALAAGIAIGLGAFAAAWSQGAIGSALMGAIAERPEIEGKAIVYLVLPEVLAVLAFIIAFLLIGIAQVAH